MAACLLHARAVGPSVGMGNGTGPSLLAYSPAPRCGASMVAWQSARLPCQTACAPPAGSVVQCPRPQVAQKSTFFQNDAFFGVDLTPLHAPATAGYFGQASSGTCDERGRAPRARQTQTGAHFQGAWRPLEAMVPPTSPACLPRPGKRRLGPHHCTLCLGRPSKRGSRPCRRWLWTRSRPTCWCPTA